MYNGNIVVKDCWVYKQKMDYLLETRIADKIIRIVGRPHLSENFEQCVGYLIVKNINNNITVDNSHICDIIDY